jgi:ABC-type multidrug transport system fused ATPase/permease subunit
MPHRLRGCNSRALRYDQVCFVQVYPFKTHLQDNITFEYPFDKERYEAVIEACALKPDFATLEDGDLTEIGSKGVSLSGGQKARVALARAIYAPTEYVILDDIFSAVDSHTARFLYDKLLRGPLVANRTLLLVTHHVELVLPGTHFLVQMAEGKIVNQGTPAELKARGELEFVAHEVEEDTIEEAADDANAKKKKNVQTGEPGQGAALKKPARKLVEEEVRAEGGVKWSVYKIYLEAS